MVHCGIGVGAASAGSPEAILLMLIAMILFVRKWCELVPVRGSFDEWGSPLPHLFVRQYIWLLSHAV
jgi:hypothetical protein